MSSNDDSIIAKYTSGEIGRDWQNLKKIAENDPGLQQEIVDSKSARLKDNQHYRTNNPTEFENQYGQKIKVSEAYAERVVIRKAASKYIADRDQLNRFVTARDFDSFKGSKTKE